MPLRYRALPWNDLGREDLYAEMSLRQAVFVVEQTCAYLDADGKDRLATHLFGERTSDGALVAYARVFPAGALGEEAVIGRVVTHPDARGTGLGRALMNESLKLAQALSPGAPIYVGAQAHLERFYASLGFARSTENYDEDGIPHLGMTRPSA
jgi:ElaA protein